MSWEQIGASSVWGNRQPFHAIWWPFQFSAFLILNLTKCWVFSDGNLGLKILLLSILPCTSQKLSIQGAVSKINALFFLSENKRKKSKFISRQYTFRFILVMVFYSCKTTFGKCSSYHFAYERTNTCHRRNKETFPKLWSWHLEDSGLELTSV